MSIPADDVFAETMSADMIEASDRRTQELNEDYEAFQKNRENTKRSRKS
ncbi:hypothetical protein [Rhizobium sp. 18055]|nr:hypothetical protein [Rhizobium sp. 18055]